jgi:hypothetical protein
MMRTRFGIYTASAFSFLVISVPRIVFGASPFPIVPQTGVCRCPGTAPDYGCVLQVFQNVVNAAVILGVIMCVMWIAYAGFTLMISGGNPKARSQGKTRIANSIIGIAVILCSWIIVDFVMKTLYDPATTFESGTFGPWNNILAPAKGSECIKQKTPNALSDVIVPLTTLTPGTSVSSGGGGGTCTAPANGPCSVAQLSQTCFGSNAGVAAGFCNKESGGVPANSSRTDILADGNPYSFGLFQTNLTNSFDSVTVNGKKCSAAFSGPCQAQNGVNHVTQSGSNIGHCDQRVTDQALYNACVTQARSASAGIQAACSLSKNGSSWSHWSTHQNGSLVPECQTSN